MDSADVKQDIGAIGHFDVPLSLPKQEGWRSHRPPYLRLSLGFGDLIALSGAAVILAQRHGGLKLPVFRHNMENAKALFVHHPEIELWELDQTHKWTPEALDEPGSKLLVEIEREMTPLFSPIEHFQFLYGRLEIDYDERWNSCPLEKACGEVPQYDAPDETYAFVHQHAARRFLIDKSKIPPEMLKMPILWPALHNDPNQVFQTTILSYADQIRGAAAGHVIDSAFFWMAEHIKRKSDWYLHRYARPHLAPWQSYQTRQHWTIL